MLEIGEHYRFPGEDMPLPKNDLTLHRTSLDALTGIRFLAAFYVVLYHSKLSVALSGAHHVAASHFIENGFSAVSLFFLLSGFILAYTYTARVSTPALRRRFWEARFARLYPVYLISLIVTVAVQAAMPKLSYTIAAALMVQAWNPFDSRMWGACNYVCWTLSVEAFFYLVFPWYQLAMERIGTRWIMITTFVMLMLAIFLNSTRHVLGYQDAFGAVPLPLLRLPEFMIGIGLGNLFLWIKRRPKPDSEDLLPGRGLITYSAAIVSVVLLCRSSGPFMSLVLIPFAMLILGLASESSLLVQILGSNILVFGGGISYAVYLLQVAAKDFTINEANKLHVGSAALRFVAMMALLTLGSVAAYKGIEIPMREKIRSYFAKLEFRRTGRGPKAEAQGTAI